MTCRLLDATGHIFTWLQNTDVYQLMQAAFECTLKRVSFRVQKSICAHKQTHRQSQRSTNATSLTSVGSFRCGSSTVWPSCRPLMSTSMLAGMASPGHKQSTVRRIKYGKPFCLRPGQASSPMTWHVCKQRRFLKSPM